MWFNTHKKINLAFSLVSGPEFLNLRISWLIGIFGAIHNEIHPKKLEFMLMR